MRNWFILFTTTFTITTLILAVTTWLVRHMPAISNQYIILLAISSALISLFIVWFNRFSIDHMIIRVTLDIFFIFAIVYGTGLVIQLIPLEIFNFVLVLALVIIIYIIITLIYMFILGKETENMNKKILNWRENHADSNSPE